MIGFQPYETFQLLIETGGIDRTNTLLVAACDAYARRGKPTPAETEQFAALAQRLFQTAAPSARAKAAATLGRAESLSPQLEELVTANLGDDLPDFLVTAPTLSEATMLKTISGGDTNAAAALARRGDLGNVVLARLFQLNSRKVYRALAGNTAIAPRGPYLSALARSAQMDHQVAWSLAARDDFDCGLLAPAFFDLNENDRIKVIKAFAQRQTPAAPIKRTLEQLSVATADLTKALMKLFSENRRPEVTRLLHQITGLDEVRCGQIAHDTSGAALFVVLRAFGCIDSILKGSSLIATRSPHALPQSAVVGSLGVAGVISMAFVYAMLVIWKLEYGKSLSGPFFSLLTRRDRAEDDLK